MSKWIPVKVSNYNLKTNEIKSTTVAYECPKCLYSTIEKTNYCPCCGNYMYEE